MIIEKNYYIEENGELFGIVYYSKEIAIDTYLKHIKQEEETSEYWKKHAQKHREYIKNGKVKVVEIIKRIEVEKNKEILLEE